jgi:hypothetical protein
VKAGAGGKKPLETPMSIGAEMGHSSALPLQVGNGVKRPEDDR